MQYGICHLSIVPLRKESSDESELVSQILYGEHFKVLEQRKKWSLVRLDFDKYEGWIDNKQFQLITKEEFEAISKKEAVYSSDLIEFIGDAEAQLYPIPLGSSLHNLDLLDHSYDGNVLQGKQGKSNLINTALLYLNSPYLWGGKTPFGLDCSGFTQMVL